MDPLLDTLPKEMVLLIRDFVYRGDWRTCKKEEASLITSFTKTVREASWLEGSEEFTLFGQWFLIYLPHELYIPPRQPPLIPPDFKRFREDYRKWYIHYVQWIMG